MTALQAVPFARVREHDLPVPTKQTKGAAAFDLPSDEHCVIPRGGQAAVRTGWMVAIPPGYCGQVWPRSGWAVKQQIDRRAGLIDEDYRGELVVVLRNESSEDWEIQPGDRIAQLVLVLALDWPSVEVDRLDDTARGENGFGHTGTN